MSIFFNISERIRELATIKVLGFYPGETASYVFRENMILTLIGALVGIVMGAIVGVMMGAVVGSVKKSVGSMVSSVGVVGRSVGCTTDSAKRY